MSALQRNLLKNRRRERPGSRTRHSLSRKEAFRHDCAEGLAVARDANIHLPFEYAKPSPLRRQTFDQSWEKWKAREAEQKIQAERERVELENEQRRLFGGDVGDDELHRLGILYSNDVDDTSLEPHETLEDSSEYSIRYLRRKTARTPPDELQFRLPSFIISSFLSDNPDIARFMANPSLTPSLSASATIQHQSNPQSFTLIDLDFESAFSQLASSSSLSSPSPSPPLSPVLIPSKAPTPRTIDPDGFPDEAWDFIDSTPSTTSSPSLDPEAWILLSDDS